ncbi:MAG: FAD-dependent oxidoreductase [Oscillospiraceae bacterium]|nr:FAD-dependent oxidoreductase [Oscillospiraceae bacterium]
MSTKYPLSMSPIKIGNVTIKNRYAAGSVSSRFFINGFWGEWSQNGIDFEVSRARGGFGLIITGSNYGDQSVDGWDPKGDRPSLIQYPKITGDSTRELTRRAHEYGAKIFLQMGFGPGRMRNGNSCSALPSLKDPSKTTPVLTKEEIETLLDGHARLAKYAKDNGFDGVEIHAHFGYLLDQFEMECTNKRTDEYGGNLENRLLIYKKDIEGIKAACGKDFPVAIRMGAKTYMKSFTEATIDGSNEFGRDIDETVEMCKLLESYGIDMFDLNSGTYESHYYCTNPYYMPKGYNIHLAKRVKEAVNVPVFCVGMMDDPEMCEQAIADGSIDGMTLCRSSMLDPAFAAKVAAGREEDIRPCIQCANCEYTNLTVSNPFCSANPAALQQTKFGVHMTTRPKKVAVIGGGIAGMVAAHTAATAGHQVALYEKSDALGGHLIAIGEQPFKQGVKKLNAWYQKELKELGVDIHLNADMCADCIKDLNAEVVIIALGSEAAVPSIPGIDGKNVVYAQDVMFDKATVGQKVVVVGGGCLGGEIAYQLTGKGKDVTVVDKHDKVAADKVITDDVRQMLNELLAYKGAEVIGKSTVVEINENGVVVESECGSKTEVAADTVVIATGMKARPTMFNDLLGCGKIVYQVGDCTKDGQPTTIQKASAQAYEIARSL